jgi:hypothetical protein
VPSGELREARDVLANRLLDGDSGGGLASGPEVLQRRHGVEVVDGVVADDPVEHLRLLIGFGVAQVELLHEAVEFGHREFVRAVPFDGVLGRDNGERLRQVVRLAVDGDLRLLHRFQQCGLRLGRRAVDLVAEDDVGEHGTGAEVERLGLLVEDVDPGHVRREEVGRELDALERPLERLGDGAGEHRLPDAGHVFEENVSASEQGGEDVFDLGVVADDDRLDVVDDPRDDRLCVVDIFDGTLLVTGDWSICICHVWLRLRRAAPRPATRRCDQPGVGPIPTTHSCRL